MHGELRSVQRAAFPEVFSGFNYLIPGFYHT